MSNSKKLLTSFLLLLSLGFFVGALLRAMVLVSVDRIAGGVWFFVLGGLICGIGAGFVLLQSK